MLVIRIVAVVEPVPFARPRFSRGRVFNAPRYEAFKERLGIVARGIMAGRAPLTGKVRLRADFYKTRPKDTGSRLWGDLDNHLKAVLDALTGICYADDSQVVELAGTKNHGEPRIEITLEEL